MRYCQHCELSDSESIVDIDAALDRLCYCCVDMAAVVTAGRSMEEEKVLGLK